MAETEQTGMKRPAKKAKDAKDETAKLVADRWQAGQKALSDARRHYWLNAAFYEGKQWVQWDASSGSVLPLRDRQLDTERVRVTVNKIESRIDTLLGVLCERDLVFEGDPTDADDSSLAGSRLGEAILEAARQENDWESIREEDVLNGLLGGTSAVAVEWSGEGGERLWVDPSNQKVIGTGEVSLIPLSIAEFTLEPGSRRFANANWWIGATSVPPKQAQEHYGLKWTPDADAARAGGPLTRNGAPSQKDLVTVYVLYERPNANCPKGRQVAVINETTVYESEWLFPFERLNISVLRQGRMPMRWWGKTFVSAARPVQVLYNAARSNIAEHMKLASNARLLIPEGSLADPTMLSDEAGEVVPYYQDQGTPSYLVPPGLQRSILEECSRLQDELDDILHVHDVSRGVAPGDRNSGSALALLAEKNNTPLGPFARDIARHWSTIGTMVLDCYADKVDNSREAVVPSPTGVPLKRQWTGKDLRGQTAVRVPLDATAPHTRAQMLAQLQSLQQMNVQAFNIVATPERLLRLTGLSSTRELLNGMNRDTAKAHRENDLMTAEQVALPAPFDDHAVHIAEHNDFRKTTAFEQLSDEQKQMMEAHIVAHQRLAEEEVARQAQMNAVRPGLGALPQADEPIGSGTAVPFSQQGMSSQTGEMNA